MGPRNDWIDGEDVSPVNAIREKYLYGHYPDSIRNDIQTLLNHIDWYKTVSKDMCHTCRSYMETLD